MEIPAWLPGGVVVNSRNKSQDISTGDSTLFKQLVGTEVMNRQTKNENVVKRNRNKIALERC